MNQASDQDDDEPELTREDRLRRVVLVCTFFMRKLAYYRGARESPAGWWDLPLRPEAGHQFGTFVPQLGDGRATLIGEVIDRAGTQTWRSRVRTDVIDLGPTLDGKLDLLRLDIRCAIYAEPRGALSPYRGARLACDCFAAAFHGCNRGIAP